MSDSKTKQPFELKRVTLTGGQIVIAKVYPMGLSAASLPRIKHQATNQRRRRRMS